VSRVVGRGLLKYEFRLSMAWIGLVKLRIVGIGWVTHMRRKIGKVGRGWVKRKDVRGCQENLGEARR
jgi:hypothetical protein